MLLLGYLVMMPPYLLREGRSYRAWLRPEKEPYTGVLKVWHIVGFKPYIGSLSAWLSSCAAQVEDDHFGVFFQVEAITPEDYAARVAKGERADLYSFPLGLLPGDALCALDAQLMPGCLRELRDCAAYGEAYGAAPYALSGRLLFLNLGLLQTEGISMPDEPDEADPLIKAAQETAEEAFREGKAAYALGDVRLAGELTRRIQTGKGFAFETRAYTNATELVQLLGIDKEIEPEKMPYAQTLIQTLYAPDAQKKLCEIGLFPAVETEEPTYAAQGLQPLYDRLRAPRIPPAF